MHVRLISHYDAVSSNVEFNLIDKKYDIRELYLTVQQRHSLLVIILNNNLILTETAIYICCRYQVSNIAIRHEDNCNLCTRVATNGG